MEKLIIKKDSRVLFLGDSITDVKFNFRFASSLKGRDIYALQLKRRFKKFSRKIKVYIRGTASDRTYHVCDRLTKDCISLKPDVIIMLLGVNDAWERYKPEDYGTNLRDSEAHMREICQRISRELPKAQMLYLRPFMTDAVSEKIPFHNTLDKYSLIFSDIAGQYGFITLDLQQSFTKAQQTFSPESLAIDGIHPTAKGHRLIADETEKLIEYSF